MKKIIMLTIFILISGGFSILSGQSSEYHDSYVEFPYVVMTGQIIEVTPFSIKVGNTKFETKATNEQVKRLVEEHLKSIDFRSHGFARALNIVEIDENNKMQLAFYLDNLTKIFHDEVQTYMKFLPAYYIFRNNIEKFKLPPDVMEELKKHSLDYYLKLPEVREILDNSWFVGVFRIHPDTGKLVYYAANYYKNYEDIETDEFAQKYRVSGIIKAGMTVTMTKSVVRGRELKKEEDEKEEGTFRKHNENAKKHEGTGIMEGSGGVKSGK